MLDTRHHEEGLLDTRLAARTVEGPGAHAAEYAHSFNACQIAFHSCDLEPEESHYDWTKIDDAVAAAKAAELPITGGPIIDFGAEMLPPWVMESANDLPTLAAFMCDFLETAVNRYKADIRRWVVCGIRSHRCASVSTTTDRLRLAFRLFEAATQIDPNLELVLSVAQPWGDYLVNENQTISPLTFPDDMIRAGLRVSAVELEIRPGILPRGSFPRDLIDTYRLLNLYGILGVAIEVVLCMPSSDQADLMARSEQTIWPAAWPAGPTAEAQSAWGTSIAALALSTQHVRGDVGSLERSGNPHGPIRRPDRCQWAAQAAVIPLAHLANGPLAMSVRSKDCTAAFPVELLSPDGKHQHSGNEIVLYVGEMILLSLGRGESPLGA